MQLLILLQFCFVCGVVGQNIKDESRIWALLVAGSNTWYNYRHQADVCHAYQVLHNHGVPDDSIITMMYDDIAYNVENPTPGIIVNHLNGSDVYRGVPKDYTGKDVTPKNFLKILQGDSEGMKNVGSGRVIESGPNDHIFVNFVDHGATGLVAFPHGELTMNELNRALLHMYDNKMFGQMVLYIEACESGSMFRNRLPSNIDIYATTAASYNESSYACYYDKRRQTFLGDWYSVRWMENSDKANLHKESLIDQFSLIRKETNTSHVQEFGDLTLGREPVAEFQGEKAARPIYYPEVPFSAAPCHEAVLDIHFRRHRDSKTPQERQENWEKIQHLLKKRRYVEEIYKSIVKDLSSQGSIHVFRLLKTVPDYITQFDCHDKVVHGFSNYCFNFGENPYALKYAYILANLCEEHIPVDEIMNVIKHTCRNVQSFDGGIH